MQDNSGQTFGIASVIMGALTFGIQIVGGLICGWIGWPLGFAAIVCGVFAFTKGNKGLGITGIVLSVIGVLIQILAVIGFVGSF